MPESSPLLADSECFCDAYRFPADTYDEMCIAMGELRPHWEYPMRALGKLGTEALQARRDEIRRLVRQNGVTYNVYGDPQGAGRAWELDLIPFIVQSTDWAPIEHGLIQRAELLSLVLQDIYGSQALLRAGVLPAPVVVGHPGYLRPCAGIPTPGRRALPLCAVDLARAPDGTLYTIGDRCQAPSGAGYALENRIVASRVLPSLFRDANVHRLAGFFRTMRTTLAALAPEHRDQPNIMVITPGPCNEAYFEHAYLAGYLGYTLVQGEDLLVSQGSVWLKTLDGLQPVDVILRRLDEEYCDPLELREDSFLGVPGLVQAARSGRVAIANPLGSGVLENAALHAFMPALSRHLLGEDLRLPSVPSWWCGTATGLSHVLANLGQMVIKMLHPRLGTRTTFGYQLGAQGRAELCERIKARPEIFVGQMYIPPSTGPVLTPQGLEARHMVLRSFLVAGEHAYTVMPGGLTRASGNAGEPIVSNQRGGINKDTWLVASEPVRPQTLLSMTRSPAALRSDAGQIPSRTADDLFWLGRYAERAECTARLLRVVLMQLIDPNDGEGPGSSCLEQLLRAATHQTMTYPGFVGEDSPQLLAKPEEELHQVLADPALAGGLAQTLAALVQSARAIRDRLSPDTWRVLNHIEIRSSALQTAGAADLGAQLEELDALVPTLIALSGVFSETMIRGQGWLFLEIGRRLERALHTCRLLRTTLAVASEPDQAAQLAEAVLAATDNTLAYRRRYPFGTDTAGTLELILADEANPRAIMFQVEALERQLKQLPGVGAGAYRRPESRLLLEVLTQARLADCASLAELPTEGAGAGPLAELMQRLVGLLSDFAEALSSRYFKHTELPHQLAPTTLD